MVAFKPQPSFRSRLLLALVTLFTTMGIEASNSAPVSWLARYLTLDTSDERNEDTAALFLSNLLAQHGLSSEVLSPPSNRPSLLAFLPAHRPDSETLVLMHHTDVVPAGPGWSFEPFDGEVKDGDLRGRGSIDVKSLGIAHLYAFIEASKIDDRRRNLLLVAVPDEEQGGGEGTRWLLESHPDRFDRVSAVLNEGGTARVVNGRIFFWGIEVAQKRPLWIRLRAQGSGGHGSSYRPHSAPHQLIQAINRVLEHPPQWRLTEEARQYFKALAPFYNAKYRPFLENPERLLTEDKVSMLEPNLIRLLVDTFQVNTLKGSEKINSTPTSAAAEVDIRLLPDTDEKAYLERLRAKLGRRIEIEVLLSYPPTESSSTYATIFQLIDKNLSNEGAVIPYMAAGTTDSRYFRQRGIPAYGFSPFALEPQDLRGIHGIDEKIPIEAFRIGLERMKSIVIDWVTGKGATED